MPQHEKAWDQGAEGEVKAAQRLEQLLAEHGVILLHDRKMPGSRANIDHIAIGPGGITVIDAKRYTSGAVRLRRSGGILSPRREQLTVGGRDRTKIVDGVIGQVEAVRAVASCDVRGVLCIVDGDIPLLRIETRGVSVRGTRGTAKIARRHGEMTPEQVHRLAAEMARRFPPALPRASAPSDLALEDPAE